MNAAIDSLVNTMSRNIAGRNISDLPPEVVKEIAALVEQDSDGKKLGRIAQQLRNLVLREAERPANSPAPRVIDERDKSDPGNLDPGSYFTSVYVAREDGDAQLFAQFGPDYPLDDESVQKAIRDIQAQGDEVLVVLTNGDELMPSILEVPAENVVGTPRPLSEYTSTMKEQLKDSTGFGLYCE